MRKSSIILEVLIVACLTIMGCKTTPQNAPNPSSTVETAIEVDGEIVEVNQRLEQIQTTLSTVTNNFALDGERRKLEQSQLRKTERQFASMGILMAGMFLVALQLKFRWHPLVSLAAGIVALGCIAGAFLLPFFFTI